MCLLALTGCTRNGANAPARTTVASKQPAVGAGVHVLFVGNSFTDYNDGLDTFVRGLAPGAVTARAAVGGYTLEQHLTAGDATRMLNEGGWDYVVLQEQSQRPVLEPERFYFAARSLDRLVRLQGGTTVLLMTWERPDSVALGVTTANLASAYDQVGAELGVPVAPAGLAFARALSGSPDLRLDSQSGHPTIEGSYLAACVVYGTVFKRSPVGNPYVASGMTSGEAVYLQRIAAMTLGY